MNVLRQHADSVNGLEQKVTEMENEGTLSLDYEKLAKDILELIEDREKGNLKLMSIFQIMYFKLSQISSTFYKNEKFKGVRFYLQMKFQKLFMKFIKGSK